MFIAIAAGGFIAGMATRGKSNGQNASAELNEEITKLKDEVGKMEKHVKVR